VGLSLFSDSIEELTPIKSSSTHLNKLFTLLDHKINVTGQQSKKTNVVTVLHEIAEKIHKRSLIIIFSDMFDGSENHEDIFKALQHLKHNKHEVILFHVTDHQTELKFSFAERPYEFIDLESGEKLTLHPAEIKDQFETELSKLHAQLKLKCNQLKIDFISVDSKSNYTDVLQAYLIKRSKMR
jgi:uncharacterized protein (DUF58 family)